MEKATLTLDGKTYELDVVVGSEQEVGIDISKLRTTTGAITLDPGYTSTGSCQSSITFIDGEKGILSYRGYPIEQCAEHATFEEIAYLIVWGELPNQQQLATFKAQLNEHQAIPSQLVDQFDALPDIAEIIFETPGTETGTIVLEKDNPSGLSENDAKIEIPVRFEINSAD